MAVPRWLIFLISPMMPAAHARVGGTSIGCRCIMATVCVWGAALTCHRPEIAGRKHAAIGGRHQIAVRVGVAIARRH